ncbi:MAG: hypothetical protein WCC59_09550, partial [Terriglobales bacterium]
MSLVVNVQLPPRPEWTQTFAGNNTPEEVARGTRFSNGTTRQARLRRSHDCVRPYGIPPYRLRIAPHSSRYS